jgi:hypothetical protein
MLLLWDFRFFRVLAVSLLYVFWVSGLLCDIQALVNLCKQFLELAVRSPCIGRPSLNIGQNYLEINRQPTDLGYSNLWDINRTTPRVFRWTWTKHFKLTCNLCYLNDVTNSMQPSSSWEAISLSATQQFPTLYRTRMLIAVFTWTHHWTLSWAGWIQSHPILFL